MEKELQQQDNFELIQRYFDFELNDQELADVEQRLQNDEAFLEDMRLYNEMSSFIEEQLPSASAVATPATDKMEQSANTAKVIQLDAKPRQSSLSKWILRVAAVAMLLLASIVALRLFNTTNSSDLAQQFWDNSEKTLFTNVRSDQAETLIQQASVAFVAGDYASTLKITSEILTTDATTLNALLLRGQTYFELEDYEAAIRDFEDVVSVVNNDYQDVAHWYLALAQLKIDDTTAAKQQLELIIDKQYPQMKQAKTLLEQL